MRRRLPVLVIAFTIASIAIGVTAISGAAVQPQYDVAGNNTTAGGGVPTDAVSPTGYGQPGRVNPVSDTDWSNGYGGDGNEVLYSISRTNDGGYIAAGTSRTDSDGLEAYLVKVDSDGNQEWVNRFGGAGDDGLRSVSQTDDGGYVVSGYSGESAWVVRLGTEGTVQWERFFETQIAHSVKQTDGGSYIVTTGEPTASAIQLNSEGEIEWRRTFGGDEYDWFIDVETTPDDGFVFAGATYSITDQEDAAWVVKTDSQGQEEWTRTFDNPSFDWFNDADVAADGDYIIGGGTRLDGLERGQNFVVELSSEGETNWKHTSSTDQWDQIFTIEQSPNDTYVAGGIKGDYPHSSSSLDPPQGVAQFIRFADDGEVLRRNLTSQGNEIYYDFAVSSSKLAGTGSFKTPDIGYQGWIFQKDSAESDNDAHSAQNALAINEEDNVGYVIEDGDIVAFDMSSREQLYRFSAPDGTDQGLAYGAGSLWYSDAVPEAYDGRILELDPQTGDVRSEINVGYDPYGLGFGDGSLWVGEVTGVPNNVYEFSPDGEQIGSFDISGPAGSNGPNGLAYYDDSVWVGTHGTLVALDKNGNIERRIDNEDLSYSGLAGTESALYGPDANGDLSVILGSSDDGSGDGKTVSLSPATMTLPPEGSVTAGVVVQNISDGVGAYNFELSVNDTSVATIESVDLAGNPDVQTVSVDEDGSSASVEAALAGTADDGDVTISSVTFSTHSRGDVAVDLVVNALGNEGGESYEVSTVEDGTIRVEDTAPVVIGNSPATDPDGDGLYEDINGDGSFNIVDVQALFANRGSDAIQNNPSLFDFNRDGTVNVVDVQALFQEV